MDECLQAIISEDLRKEKQIPVRVLSSARDLFELSLRQLENDKNPKTIPMPP